MATTIVAKRGRMYVYTVMDEVGRICTDKCVKNKLFRRQDLGDRFTSDRREIPLSLFQAIWRSIRPARIVPTAAIRLDGNGVDAALQ